MQCSNYLVFRMFNFCTEVEVVAPASFPCCSDRSSFRWAKPACSPGSRRRCWGCPGPAGAGPRRRTWFPSRRCTRVWGRQGRRSRIYPGLCSLCRWSPPWRSHRRSRSPRLWNRRPSPRGIVLLPARDRKFTLVINWWKCDFAEISVDLSNLNESLRYQAWNGGRKFVGTCEVFHDKNF